MEQRLNKMEYNNRLNRSLEKVNKLPKFIRPFARNKAIGSAVPLVGTAGIKFEKISCTELIAHLPNKRKVQNHIGQVHAAASVLLAETATGILLGVNIPDDKIPLIKSMSTKFIKRSVGRQTAVATLKENEINEIRTLEKGDVNIEVKVVDETGEEVIVSEMIWAWIPKK
jgi:acyl-coenzyme A thioesterase PaaI-like protein